VEQAVGKSHVASKEEITNTAKRSMSPPLYLAFQAMQFWNSRSYISLILQLLYT